MAQLKHCLLVDSVHDSRGYKVNIGKINELEVDFIAESGG
jgi:hypothetical protein